MSLNIPCIDARPQDAGHQGVRQLIASLRQKLSIDGDVASPRSRELTMRVFGEPLSPRQVVERICSDVQRDRDRAICYYSKQLDRHDATPEQLRVPQRRIEEAHRAASRDFLDAVRRIRESIEVFQRAILHRSVTVEPRPGIRLQQRYLPMERVGICVPGGAAAYPSSVLMTAVPAQVAGVKQIAMMAPPTPFGAFNSDVLAVCYELGIDEVYAMGGAHGVAGLAYGTESVPAVDKIVGPGSLYVALAKKWVFGNVDIDSIAGPSEVIVIADESAPAAYVAADMLAQAEHSPGSSVLITWSESTFDAVRDQLALQLESLERNDLTRDALQDFGAMILVRDSQQAIELTNELAPEHLEIVCHQPHQVLERIRNAGATFIGPYSPVAVGDYAAGPSHVLPTCGTSRWASGLSANSFLRSGSVIEYDQHALIQVAGDVQQLANKEGLTAHRRSIDIRTHGQV